MWKHWCHDSCLCMQILGCAIAYQDKLEHDVPLVNQCYAEFWWSIQALINTSSKHVRNILFSRQLFRLKTLLTVHLEEILASVQGQVPVLPALWRFRRTRSGGSGSFPTVRSPSWSCHGAGGSCAPRGALADGEPELCCR